VRGTDAPAANSQPLRWLTIAAFGVALYMIFAGLGQLALIEPDEGRNAEVAREMAHATEWSRAWLIPTLDGLPYMDKPAFYFKTVALTFAAFGESETTARLSSALFGLLLLGMTYLFSRRVYNTRTAALTVMIMVTAPLYFVFARLVIMDMTLAFFVCGAIFAGYLAEENDGARRARWYLLASASAGVATLVKGPIGFFLPFLVLTCFNWLDGKRGFWKRYLAPWNVVLFLAIVLPWFLGASYFERDFAYYGLVRETFLRLTTGEFRRSGPMYYFVPWIIFGFLAWSLLLPEGILAAWKTRKGWHRADRLFVVWSVAVFIFFSLSQSKRPDYILTIIVSLGALVARIFDRAFERADSRAVRLVRRSATALAILTMLTAMFVCLGGSRLDTWRAVFHLKPESAPWVIPTLPGVLVASLVVFVLAVVASVRRNSWLAFAAFVLIAPLTGSAAFGGLKSYAESRSSRVLVQQFAPLPAGTEIACLDKVPTALLFYLKQPIYAVCDSGYELSSFYIGFKHKQTHSWPSVMVPRAKFAAWVGKQNHPVYVLAEEDGRAELEAVAAEHHAHIKELPPDHWGALIFPKNTGRTPSDSKGRR